MKTSQEQVQHIRTEKDMRNYISLKDGFFKIFKMFYIVFIVLNIVLCFYFSKYSQWWFSIKKNIVI